MKNIITAGLAIILLLSFTGNTFAGYALRFHGGDDIVWLNNGAFDGLGDCTVEYWIYIVYEREAACPISCANMDESNEYMHFFQVQDDAGFVPYIKHDHDQQDIDFPRNEWFHFAMTRNGGNGQWTAFINGERAGGGSLDAGDLRVEEGGVTMGQDQDNFGGGFNVEQALNGMLDEFRVWNFIRSEREIRETKNCMVAQNSDGLVAYYRFDEGDRQVVHDLTNNNYNGILGNDENEDDADPEWIISEAPIAGGELEIPVDYLEFGPVIRGNQCNIELEIINTVEEDDDSFIIEFEITDSNQQPCWIEIEPTEGIVRPRERVTINFTAITEELNLGEHERTIALNCNAANLQHIEIPAHIFITEGFGQLFGVVTDEENNQAVEGTIVSIDEFRMADTTDLQGRYSFPDIPAWIYNLRVTKPDYLPIFLDDIEITPNVEEEINFSLLHAEFEHIPSIVNLQICQDTTIYIPLLIRNSGNGPLTWNLHLFFPDRVEIDPWLRRNFINAGTETDDGRLEGVIFARNHFYISGANSNEPSMIYILDADGRFSGSFQQPGNSRYGMCDMAYDGKLIWGAGERTVFGFNTNGETEISFNGPHNDNRAIAWDRDRELLWISDLTTDIVSVNRNGDREYTLDRKDLRIYGLAYYPNDPDNMNLYIFHDVEEKPILHKMNTDTGDTMFVKMLETEEGGSARSAFITNRLDALSWVFIDLINNSYDSGWDRIDIWQICDNTEWIQVNPSEGIVEPQNDTELTLSFCSEGLISERYHSDLIYLHDGAGNTDTINTVFEITNDIPIDSREFNNRHEEYGLLGVSPNPFNSNLKIEYLIENDNFVEIRIFDLNGREIKSVKSGWQKQGNYSIFWNAEDLPSGLYLIRMTTPESTNIMKALLLR
ncbi:T9SS type A sorting domain-containing protein [bacterium]|nr:T9SS type A sorting domain-containing protein [bacterium]